MKRIISMILVSIMLICMIPFSASAAYVKDVLPITGIPLNRLAEFTIDTNGGYYNAASGAAISNNGFYTAANELNIAHGHSGVISIRVYSVDDMASDLKPFNHYVGVVYWNGNLVSPGFYPLGDLLTVIYKSLAYDGKVLNSIKWGDAINFVSTSFQTESIVGAVLDGSTHFWTANWGCYDHSFGENLICIYCNDLMQSTYTVGDYTYTALSSPFLGVQGGWIVTANDKTKTSYGAIRDFLHGFPVTVMYKTFDDCTNLTTAPAIPEGIIAVYNAYKGTSITATPSIPSTVTTLYGAFKNCKNLNTVGAIPANVTDMTFAFSGCTSLTTAPAIPAACTTIKGAFKDCTALTSAPDVSHVANIEEAFDGCINMGGAVTVATANNTKAFRNTAVTTVNLATNTVAQGCFSECNSIKNVNFTGTSAQWINANIAAYNTALTKASVSISNLAAKPSVTVKNNKTYVCDMDGDNVKDIFIAYGHQGNYRAVADNKFYGAFAAKLAGTDIFTYGNALKAGDYTLLVRYLDGTMDIVHFSA